MALSESQAEFKQYFDNTVLSGYKALGIALGHRLGLFDVLAKFDTPKTSQEIADAANYKERYVREWLGLMVVSKIITMDTASATYILPRDHVAAVTSPVAMFSWNIPLFGSLNPSIMECFKLDGPKGIPYQKDDIFHSWYDSRRGEEYGQELCQKLIPSVPGLRNILENGGQVCDIGCGTATGITPHFAKQFPASTFYGIDILPSAIEKITASAKEMGLTNTRYATYDAADLPDGEWTDKFDWLFTRDVLHDIARPEMGAKEIFRTCKPGGYFSVIELDLDDNPVTNANIAFAPAIYCASLHRCIPMSLNDDGAGLGATWGRENASKLLRSVGFEIVFAKSIDFDTHNCHILARKPTE
ncbi:unnamed protein product [Owenia fusiformis]|uniref:Uncharacterized protein n=1 Tax=Owenia fusiformis TaxID=6347 RepID=A0A8J1UVP3_OWEFU|nr:unnamed protein product [Owenia fusiformis]